MAILPMQLRYIGSTISVHSRYSKSTISVHSRYSKSTISVHAWEPLNVAYIDIKAAFDSVDWAALWKALRSSGAPPFLIQLIEHLHTGTTSRVRVGGQLSEPFETTYGVRQSCVLAPALFCISIDFASSVERILLWSCWQRQTVGPLKTTKFVDNRFSPRYNRFSCFLL